MNVVQVNNIRIGLNQPLVLIAGPCVVESEALAMHTAECLRRLCDRCGIPLVYKSSYMKANRSSHESFSGLDQAQSLGILSKIRTEFDLPVLTDVHEFTPLDEVADAVDILQTPAFLCRQTQFMQNVAALGKPVNIKKGQFLSPAEMKHVVAKVRAGGNSQVMVCERGFSFGYNNLVSDMRSLVIMRETGCPVVFDATHSVQLPGGAAKASGGQRLFVPALARAAVAVGVAAVFMETHPYPARALSDAATSWPLDKMSEIAADLKRIDEAVKNQAMLDKDKEHTTQ